MTDAFQVIPSGAALAAEVAGIDLGQIDDETFRGIRQAWLEHQVLLFRDQRLSDADLIAFSRRFGTLDHAPIQENGRRFVDGFPGDLHRFKRGRERCRDRKPWLWRGRWHTDMSYLKDPPQASVLYALEVPSRGGETGSARCMERGNPYQPPFGIVSTACD